MTAAPRNTVLVGDCVKSLDALPEAFIQCAVTSPPYWGLRDYGIHDDPDAIGLEPTLDDHLDNLVKVFRSVRRVLRPDGVLWLNYGDAYAGAGGPQNHSNRHNLLSNGRGEAPREKRAKDHGMPSRRPKPGFKPKDLMGLPWRVAFALQDDGWWLRSDVVWNKPNPMPESVNDRPSRCHEYIFLLAKSERYFYDAEAVKVEASPVTHARITQKSFWSQTGGPKDFARLDGTKAPVNANRSVRKALENYARKAGAGTGRPQLDRAIELARQGGLTKAHLEAIQVCGITDTGKALTTQNGAGKSDHAALELAGQAKEVLKGYYREFIGNAAKGIIATWDMSARLREGKGRGDFNEHTDGAVLPMRNLRDVWTIPTQPYTEAHFATFPEALVEPCILAGTSAKGQCPACGAPWERDLEIQQEYGALGRDGSGSLVKGWDKDGKNLWRDGAYVPPATKGWKPTCQCPAADPVPQIVLDPFFGSGTTGLVSKRLGRDFLGTELNPAYAAMALRRLSPVLNHRIDSTWSPTNMTDKTPPAPEAI